MVESSGELQFHRELPKAVFLRLSEIFAVEVNTTPRGGVTVELAVGEWDTSALIEGIKGGSLTKRHFLLYWVYQYELIHRSLYNYTQKDGGDELSIERGEKF